jgi:sugar-specific transcriptional regulator TrmB
MDLREILQQIGLNDRESAVYMRLLASGGLTIRQVQDKAGLDRKHALVALKSLERQGLATAFKRHKKEMFQAADPESLAVTLSRREQMLATTRRQLAELMPEIRAVYAEGGNRTAVRHYQGSKGVALVLKEVLQTVAQLPDRTYHAYSSGLLREHLYKEYPKFTRDRINRKVAVEVIAAGPGGEAQPLSERRWLEGSQANSAYTIIFGPKVAFFTLDSDSQEPQATVIDDGNLADAQRLIFRSLWGKLN